MVYSALKAGSGEQGEGVVFQTGLLVRFGVSLFLALNIMVFSLALYGERVYGSELGLAPAEIRGFFRWLVFALSVPAIWLLGEPLARAALSTAGAANRSYHALILASVAAALGVSMRSVFTGMDELYFDTCVMLLLLVTLGRLLEGWLRAKATREARDLLASGHRRWRAWRGEAREGVEVAAEELLAGDEFALRPGERAPVDAVVVEGRSEFSAECRDGSLEPIARGAGERVRSGELNLGDPVTLRADPAPGAPFWSRYCALAAEALEHPAPAERLANRVASFLLPATAFVALASFAFWWHAAGDLGRALLIGASVLVVACPCAMGLATPVALRLAVSEALKFGALPRSAEVFERFAAINHFVIDNTGTMTSRTLSVANATLDPGTPKAEALAAIGGLAERSAHPVARALAAWGATAPDGLAASELADRREVKGAGLEGIDRATGATWRVGSRAWVEERGASWRGDGEPKGTVFASKGDRVVAAFELDAALRPDTEASLAALLDMGKRVTLMTGAAELPRLDAALAKRLAGNCCRQTPEQKLRRVEALRQSGERVAMVGDGLNDLLALAAANVGVAVGEQGGANFVADVALAGEGIAALPKLARLAAKTRAIVRRNFAWVVGYNALAVGAAAAGALHPLMASALMAISSALIVGRAFGLRERPPFVQRSEEPEPKSEAAEPAVASK